MKHGLWNGKETRSLSLIVNARPSCNIYESIHSQCVMECKNILFDTVEPSRAGNFNGTLLQYKCVCLYVRLLRTVFACALHMDRRWLEKWRQLLQRYVLVYISKWDYRFTAYKWIRVKCQCLFPRRYGRQLAGAKLWKISNLSSRPSNTMYNNIVKLLGLTRDYIVQFNFLYTFLYNEISRPVCKVFTVDINTNLISNAWRI